MEQDQHSADTNKQPFCVPQGYFNNLPRKVMQQIDAHNEQQAKQQHAIRRMRRLYIAAASIFAAVFGVATYLATGYQSPATGRPAPTHATAVIPTTAVDKDEMADYTMMDNEDIYECYSEI